MKVVFHLNSIDHLGSAISNIKNILKTDIEEVKLLINGSAINLFKDTENNPGIIDSRFVILACQNSMRTHEVSESDLFSNTIAVSSGVYTLVELQHKSYSYIKP